jgi:hypothetical protein
MRARGLTGAHHDHVVTVSVHTRLLFQGSLRSFIEFSLLSRHAKPLLHVCTQEASALDQPPQPQPGPNELSTKKECWRPEPARAALMTKR